MGSSRNAFDVHVTPRGPIEISKQSLVEIEALQAGLTTVRTLPRKVEAHQDGRSIRWAGASFDTLPKGAARSCSNKARARRVLRAAGVRVPRGRRFAPGEHAAAVAYAHHIGWPVVVKPVSGMQGRDVSTGIRDDTALALALSRVEGPLLVERHVDGGDYRIFASRGEALSVVRRDPAHVIGDGVHTVRQLVEQANLVRAQNPHLGRPGKAIILDADGLRMLAEQQLTPDDVPEPGRRVRCSSAANLSRGGESVEVLDETHPSVLDVAVSAVRAVPGLEFAGVDLMMRDHRDPVDGQKVYTIEINHNPAPLMHLWPMYGPSRNVVREWVRQTATHAGMQLEPATPMLTVRSEASGRLRRLRTTRWLRRRAAALGVDIEVALLSRTGAAVDVHGRPEIVGVFVRGLLRLPGHVTQVVSRRPT